jgi:hypothetical protein
MGVEADVAAQQMHAFAKTGQRRRKDPVPSGSHQVAHALPAPAAMPSAVDQDAVCHFGALDCDVRPWARGLEDCDVAADMWPERIAPPSLFFVLAPGPPSD